MNCCVQCIAVKLTGRVLPDHLHLSRYPLELQNSPSPPSIQHTTNKVHTFNMAQYNSEYDDELPELQSDETADRWVGMIDSMQDAQNVFLDQLNLDDDIDNDLDTERQQSTDLEYAQTERRRLTDFKTFVDSESGKRILVCSAIILKFPQSQSFPTRRFLLRTSRGKNCWRY